MEQEFGRVIPQPDDGSHATSPIDPHVSSAMVNIEMARIVVLGEASLLTTALLKFHHSHHSYYYGSRGGLASGLKQSVSLPNRLAFAVAVENEEDEDDFLDDTFGIISDPSNGSPSSSVHHPLPTDPILKNLIRLKGKLRKGSRSSFNVTTDPSYLIPFCEVIKNKDTSGPITGMALQSILKFINYDLVSHTESLGSVQLIGDSVTKARFIGTDTSSDEVVLMRILDVLKQLIIRGYKSLGNETICEIMQSSFRIAFEPRLSELLRKNAEQALLDMVRCLFQKLTFYTDEEMGPNVRTGMIKSGSGVKMPSGFGKKKEKMYQSSITERMEINSSANSSPTNETLPSISGDTLPVNDHLVKSMSDASLADSVATDTSVATVAEIVESGNESSKPDQVANQSNQEPKNKHRIEPHGIESINELLCYMTTLTSPLPESQNSESMINIGLNLLIVAFESAMNDIGNKSCLLKVIRDDLCFNMIQLLQSSRPLTSFALTLRLCFLVFTALRHLLKYQMEMLFTRLKELITTGNAPIEYRELSLEYLVGFFRHLPSLSHELFFNYDLDPYASNLLEDLYQFFSKNCFSSSSPNDQSVSGSGSPATGSASFSPIQLLSLDAFLTNLNSLHRAELCKDVSLIPGSEIEWYAANQSGHQSPTGDQDIGLPDPQPPSEPNFESKVVLVNPYPKTLLEIEHLKQRKRMLWMASDQFNTKPSKGIQFLKENGLVADEKEIASFLRDNSKLDKRMLGEYLSHKNNPVILNAFIDTFNLRGTRLDEALRLYLETFRLPGEAPLVSNLLEPFAVSWHINNDSPFENNDAAYTLSYAIIMLNVDQHNVNVKRQTPSMTCKQFINNLRQVNGGKDFDPKMLTQIYEAIKTKEIVMPAEHHGLLRDKYLWKCLLGKSETSSGVYWFSDFKGNTGLMGLTRRSSTHRKSHAIPLHLLNNQLFSTLWGPAIAAMTFVFDKININHNSNLTQRILNNGFSSCALLCSSYGHLDNLIVILCKFTLSSNTSLNSVGASSVNSQPLLSHKSQMAAQTLFGILREYSNYMRESWSNIVEILLHWFKSGFLDDLLEVDDFALNEKLKLKRKIATKSNKQSNESSSTFLSSFYMYFAGSNPDIAVESMKTDDETSKSSSGITGDPSSSGPSSLNTPPENLINKYCQPLSLIEESRFLHIDSLLELIKALMNVQVEVADEEDDIETFRLELLIQITLLNRDRASLFWSQLFNFLLRILKTSTDCEMLSERVISAIFRLAIRFVPRIDATSEQIMVLLRHILMNCEPSTIQKKCTATALTSFINSCHRDIHKVDDWSLIFDYLLCVGIGCHPNELPVRQSSSPVPVEDELEPVSESAVQPSPPTQLASSPVHVPSVQIQIEDDDPIQPVMPTAPPLDQQPNDHSSAEDVKEPNDSQISDQPQPQSPNVIREKKKIGPAEVDATNHRTQPFVPGSSAVRDVEAYKKCVDILTVIIKEILPKSVQTNPKSDGVINQMAIDSLITLRFYSLQDDSLRESVTSKSSNS